MTNSKLTKPQPTPSKRPDLKLIALDAEDLGVVSAHLQDAVLKVGDMAYLPRQHRFAAVLNRFDWTSIEASGARRSRPMRRRSALRFEQVRGASVLGLDMKAKSTVLSLLAIQFQPAIAPAGAVVMTFAGGGQIRLDVDCVEGELRDLGPAWAARGKPDHGSDGSDPDAGDFDDGKLGNVDATRGPHPGSPAKR